MFCANCGGQLAAGAVFCGTCGNQARSTAAGPASQLGYAGQPTYAAVVRPQRDFVATWLLSLFFGTLGVDRFYLGHAGIGVAKLLLTLFTGIGGIVWHWVDLFLLLAGKMPDAEGRPLLGYAEKRGMAIAVTVILMAIGIIAFVVIIWMIVALIVGATTGSYDYGYDY